MNSKVLIVDDNQDLAQTFEILLNHDGYTTAIVFSGDKVVELATEFRPDAILLDIGLPGMNGYEVAACLRANQLFENTFLIAMTGYGGDEDKVLAKKHGFDKHLLKPVQYQVVRNLLINGRNACIDN